MSPCIANAATAGKHAPTRLDCHHGDDTIAGKAGDKVLTALVTAAALGTLPVDLAVLRFAVDGAIMAAAVRDGPQGSELTIDCVAGCDPRFRYAEAVGDTPLGLFRWGDAEGLLLSFWSGGSAYRLRAYAIGSGKVRKLLDVATLGTPAFIAGPAGSLTIRTTERGDRDPPSAPPRAVTWTLRHGRFDRR